MRAECTLAPHKIAALWKMFLQHKDSHISFGPFKLANYYTFGKPLTIVTAAEELRPVQIDINAIPSHRVQSALSNNKSGIVI